ncbi:hypothetical protein BBJ28_00011888 [Nothophytophthora sp. Chile5]|nr:hypothetical protein BBJ28_00011888 [Nothophytophthora sp. Chile5]
MTEAKVSPIGVRQYRSGDLPAIARIFCETSLLLDEDKTFQHRWEAIARDSVATDLANIPASYIVPGGNFWVAVTTETPEEVVVGMVALQRTSETQGEVKRVSVDVNFHRRGIGRLLMAHLEDWARLNGFDSLRLSTGANSKRSVAFYVALGYEALPVNASHPLMLFQEPAYFELVELVKKL